MTMPAQQRPPGQGQLGEATLIYNPQAGGSQGTAPGVLVTALQALGYRPVYRATAHEQELSQALDGVQGTIFVAGGDGTLRAVALHLAGRPGVTLALIPLGTANNIGRMLGVLGPPLEVVQRYGPGAAVRPFDLGRVQAPWGRDVFLEACGCGVFAEGLVNYDPDAGKSPVRAMQAARQTLTHFEPAPMALELDGVPQPPAAYALIEVMNTKATGPRLRMATDADPHDGLLDLIRIDAQAQASVVAYLLALTSDTFTGLPSVEADRVRRVSVPYVGQAFHIDGEARPPASRPQQPTWVQIEVWPAALQVLVPEGGPA